MRRTTALGGERAGRAHPGPRTVWGPMTALILALDGEVSLEAGGGKGVNLARLARAGFSVPQGFILTTRAYRGFVADNELEERILRLADGARGEDQSALEAASASIRALFEEKQPSSELADAVCDAYAALGRPPVAVRSSATTEDLPGLSFAGQHDTLLNVVGESALSRAVVQCWSSLWTARALAYRARNAVPHRNAALAVVVQQLIASEVSGVLFTANPLTGKRAETVIDASLGLGEALVSGRVEPDHFRVELPAGRVLERRIGAKAVALRPRREGGTVEVHEDASERVALTDAEVLELARLGARAAELFGCPQDVEWARAGGRFHLLQSRAITTIFPLPDGLLRDGLRVLVSFGALQGVLDPITPLGQDVFRCVLPRALASLGAPFSAGGQPIVVIAGERVFLDISTVARHARLRERIHAVLRTIEPTTGEALADALSEPGPLAAAGRLRWPSPGFLWLLCRALGNLTFDLCWPDRGRARIQRRLAASIKAFEQRCAASVTLGERVALLEEVFAWLPRTGLPLLVPGFGSGLASLRWLQLLAGSAPESQARVLEMTRGLPHNVTTEMDLALWNVARVVHGAPGAAELFRTTEASALARRCLAQELPASVQAAIEAFLAKYGMRGVGEIDLGRPRWREDPTALMQVLQSYLQIENGAQAPEVVFRRGAGAARRALDSLVADIRHERFGWLRAVAMKAAARHMWALAGLRESPKFTAIAMLGTVRAALLASGRQL
ncbi:MAG: phosphoenolpyruvate synthase, partial [Planctomycetes bacterium]|nr:phosphoenolpyruvate synthase [Planctomycetota bacterium]